MGDTILNLSTWIDRRRKEVGPYADHIVHSVKAYEASITDLEEERDRLREALGEVRDGYGPNHLSKYARDIASAALEGE